MKLFKSQFENEKRKKQNYELKKKILLNKLEKIQVHVPQNQNNPARTGVDPGWPVEGHYSLSVAVEACMAYGPLARRRSRLLRSAAS